MKIYRKMINGTDANENLGGAQGTQGVLGTGEIVTEENTVQDKSHEDSENLCGTQGVRGTGEIVREKNIVQDQSREDSENLGGTQGVGGAQGTRENERDEKTVQDQYHEDSENLGGPKTLSTLMRKLICIAILVGYMILGVLVYYLNSITSMLINGIYVVVVTLTSVGYGDIVPQITFAKLTTSIYILVGFGMWAIILNYLIDDELQKLRTRFMV
ncbi:hypothetical protein TanjilG_23732 [Lupinus angustifolius]|uniref:Potassium channel domain-containing protein n=1 Tax=Lupinus angustifolius TaxID=3871 RepID=A0A1J7GGT2_LUPAN|nr:hypothetical protein TanjilG_23732 [Lupinus angustifolius]